jgi:hypothetical protein
LIHKNLKNVLLSPGELLQETAMRFRRFRSAFGAVAGLLLFTAALAPQAKADDVLVYFNFEDGTFNSVPAPGPSPPGYPFLENQTITNVDFPPGLLTVKPGVGTDMNELPGDTPITNSALSLGGNTIANQTYCFKFSVNTMGYTNLSLSFALQSLSGVTGPNPQFSSVTALYSIDGGATFVTIGTTPINSTDTLYHIYPFNNISVPANTNVIIELCFTGSSNQAHGNNTYIDNIQVTGAIPEPTTVAGGLLGVLGLCWVRRRWLFRCVRFRRT